MGVVYKSLREDYALPGEKGQCEEYRRCYRMALIKSYGGQKKKLSRQSLCRNPGCS